MGNLVDHHVQEVDLTVRGVAIQTVVPARTGHAGRTVRILTTQIGIESAGDIREGNGVEVAAVHSVTQRSMEDHARRAA